MADYVNRNILCQAYVHIETDDDYEECIETLRQVAIPLVQARASFFLYEGAGVDLEPDEGSVKSRITVFGTLLLALQAITNYKDFREGVILLADDVERVAQVAVTETLFSLRAKKRDVLRIEVRTGVVGQLRRIIADIDRVKAENGVVISRRQVERLDAIQDDIGRILDNLKDANDLKLVAGELYLLIDELPKNPLPGPKEKLNQIAVDPYRRRRAKLLAFLDGKR